LGIYESPQEILAGTDYYRVVVIRRTDCVDARFCRRAVYLDALLSLKCVQRTLYSA